jgi:prophage antirepressor-like protein
MFSYYILKRIFCTPYKGGAKNKNIFYKYIQDLIYMTKKSFVFDVLNQVLKYDERTITVIFDDKGNPWFKLKDLLILFDYKSTLGQPSLLGISDINKKDYKSLNVKEYIKSNKNIKFNTNFINESGLYELLNKSTKLIATKFKFEIFNNIMPTLRKTGEYIMSNEEKKSLETINKKLENKLENYKTELEYYYDKYQFISSEKGYIYINEVKMIYKGQKIIGYKPGYCTDMKKRKFIYKSGNFYYKLLSYIPVNIDKSKIENCYMNLFKEHKYKPKTKNELLCFLNLKDLKNGINKCINFLAENICECVYCKEKYNVSKLDKHKCIKKLANTTFIDIDIDKLLNKTTNNNDSILDAKLYIKKIKK